MGAKATTNTGTTRQVKNNRSGVNKQNNNFARASHYFVHFFAITARLSENAYFRVLWRT